MNISELCIRRPAMTVLLSAAVVVVGIFAYFQIPVAALPSYNTPVINVSAQLPGASPETMASSVALPLEKQFSTIAGLQTISSINTQGNDLGHAGIRQHAATSTPPRSTSRRRCCGPSGSCRPK